MSGQLNVPAALTQGKEPPVPIGWEVGWAPEPVWTMWRRENSWSHRDSNSDSSVVHPVGSRYTDCAIPAHLVMAAIWMNTEIGKTCVSNSVELFISVTVPISSMGRKYCHEKESLQTGFGLEIGFTVHLQDATASNYNTTTTAHLKSFQSAVFSPVVPWYRLLTMEILQLPRSPS
jgi:hypothetical protein